MTTEQIEQLLALPEGIDSGTADPAAIFLQQECCADPAYGRSWATGEEDFSDCAEGIAPTKYIRADLVLVLAEELKALRSSDTLLPLLAQVTEFQVGNHIVRKVDKAWLLFDDRRTLVQPNYLFPTYREALDAIPKENSDAN